MDLFQRLLPIRRALTPEAAALYRTEPYVLASDVYAAPAWSGHGGWHLEPHIPAAWPGFEIVWRDGATVVRIQVDNPRGVSSGVERMLLDGKLLEPPILPRLTDGRTHEVQVTMG